MPYINKEARAAIDLAGKTPANAGELNYKITKMLTAYMSAHGKSYQIMNDIMGALEGAKLEMYRRVAAPYENVKLSENGDVY